MKSPDGRPADRVSASVITLNLESELKALRASASYKRNDHASATLVNRPGLGSVLVALPKGGLLKEHRASRPILVTVLEGKVRLELKDRAIAMGPGDVAALAPGMVHTVIGIEDGAFLLAMGGRADRSSTD